MNSFLAQQLGVSPGLGGGQVQSRQRLMSGTEQSSTGPAANHSSVLQLATNHSSVLQLATNHSSALQLATNHSSPPSAASYTRQVTSGTPTLAANS